MSNKSTKQKNRFLDERLERQIKRRLSNKVTKSFDGLIDTLNEIHSVINYRERMQLSDTLKEVVLDLKEIQKEFYEQERYTPGKLLNNIIQLLDLLDYYDKNQNSKNSNENNEYYNEFGDYSYLEAAYLLTLSYEQYKKVTFDIQTAMFKKFNLCINQDEKINLIVSEAAKHYYKYLHSISKLNMVYNDDLEEKYRITIINELVYSLCISHYLMVYPETRKIIINKSYSNEKINETFNAIYFLTRDLDIQDIFKKKVNKSKTYEAIR